MGEIGSLKNRLKTWFRNLKRNKKTKNKTKKISIFVVPFLILTRLITSIFRSKKQQNSKKIEAINDYLFNIEINVFKTNDITVLKKNQSEIIKKELLINSLLVKTKSFEDVKKISTTKEKIEKINQVLDYKIKNLTPKEEPKIESVFELEKEKKLIYDRQITHDNEMVFISNDVKENNLNDNIKETPFKKSNLEELIKYIKDTNKQLTEIKKEVNNLKNQINSTTDKKLLNYQYKLFLLQTKLKQIKDNYKYIKMKEEFGLLKKDKELAEKDKFYLLKNDEKITELISVCDIEINKKHIEPIVSKETKNTIVKEDKEIDEKKKDSEALDIELFELIVKNQIAKSNKKVKDIKEAFLIANIEVKKKKVFFNFKNLIHNTFSFISGLFPLHLFKNKGFGVLTSSLLVNNSIRSMRKVFNSEVEYIVYGDIKNIYNSNNQILNETKTILTDSLYQISNLKHEIIDNYNIDNYQLLSILAKLETLETEIQNKQKELIDSDNINKKNYQQAKQKILKKTE